MIPIPTSLSSHGGGLRGQPDGDFPQPSPRKAGAITAGGDALLMAVEERSRVSKRKYEKSTSNKLRQC
jgi:hypothetical protein